MESGCINKLKQQIIIHINMLLFYKQMKSTHSTFKHDSNGKINQSNPFNTIITIKKNKK